MTIKAFLKLRGNPDGLHQIFIRYSHRGKTTDIRTGLKCTDRQWSQKHQKVDYTQGTNQNKTNKDLLKAQQELSNATNANIGTIKAQVLKIANELLANHVEPSHIAVRNAYNQMIESSIASQKNLMDVYDSFVDAAKGSKSATTIKNYRVTKTHLEGYFKKHGAITLSEVDLNFFDKWRNYMTEKGKSSNTIWGHIKNLKAALNHASSRGAKVPIKTQDVKARFDAPNIIYLTADELDKLYNHDFSKNPRLEKVRDIFVFHCYVGVRISDLSRIKKHHITDGVIRIHAQKSQSKQNMVIPLVTVSHAILEKYDYELPMISEQKLNKYIKEAAEVAKINSMVEQVSFVKGKKVITNKPKHEVLTTHHAVKTFITICKVKGIPVKTVSAITGKSVSVIMKHYEGLDDQMIISEMRNAFGDITLRVS